MRLPLFRIRGWSFSRRLGGLAAALALALTLAAAIPRAAAQGGPCDEVIAVDTVAATDTGGEVAFCVELNFAVALRSERYVNGARVGGVPDGCAFDSLVYYPTFTFPSQGAVGPYRMEAWTVNGATFAGDFADVDGLVALLNDIDPLGNWVNDTIINNVVGGGPGSRYGPLDIVQTATQRRRTVAANYSAVAGGAIVSVRGAGFHEYVLADPVSGCRDTLTLVLKPQPPDLLDTLTGAFGTVSREFCLDNDALIGTPQAPSFCHRGLSGTVGQSSAYCYTYEPAPGFVGEEEVCVVVCDDSDVFGSPVCQTTRIRVTTSPPARDCGDSVFPHPTDSLRSDGDPTTYCLPVAREDYGKYALTVDGAPYARAIGECDLDRHLFYNYAPIFARGEAGPYTLFSWTVDGTFFNAEFQDLPELVAVMRAVDPSGNWVLDADNFNIAGGDPAQTYSALVIVHDGTGTRSQLRANRVDQARGTSVDLSGAGVYALVLTDTATACASELELTIGARAPTRPTDTVRVTGFGDSPFVACAELPFPGPFDSPIFCGTDGPYAAASANGRCIEIDPDDGTVAGGAVCVLWCSATDPGDCQRVVFVITRVPACTTDVLGADTLYLPASEGPSEVCLGDGVDLSDYAISVDGRPVAPSRSPDCGAVAGGGGSGADSVSVNAYDASVVGDNSLRIDAWDVGGTLHTGIVVDDLAALADTMAALDSGATWRYDPAEVALLSDTDLGNYSQLILFDLIGGSSAQLFLEQRSVRAGGNGGSVPGSVITVGRAGTYDVIATESASGCADRQVVVRAMATPPTRDTIRQAIAADRRNGPFCLDASQLPAAPTSIESCGSPLNGAIAFVSDACYAYTPNAGYRGPDTACVVQCAGVVCDTTVIAFAVVPDTASALTPVRDTITQDVRAGQLNGPYCLDVTELPSGPYELRTCTLPQNGTFASDGDGRCYTYRPAGGFAGADTTCVVVCAGDATTCDTTVIVFHVIDAPDCDGFAALTPVAFDLANCSATARFEFSTGNTDAASVRIRLNGAPSDAESNLGVIGLELGVGEYTVVAQDSVTACASFFEVSVRCDPSCAVPFEQTSIARFVDCGSADGLLSVCLPTTLAALDSFSIALDGEPYRGRLRECGSRVLSFYDVGGLGAGPYRVGEFRIGAQTFRGDAADLLALADSLSTWDATAAWRLDGANARLIGGNPATDYGALALTELSTLQDRSLPLVTERASAGVALDIPLGAPLRNLRFAKNDSTCLQDVALELTCVSAGEDDVSVEEGGEQLYCGDVSELNGPVTSLTNACGGSEDTVALDFDEVLGCVSFRGLQLGERRVCLVACDGFGLCDTTYVNVTVVSPTEPTGPFANDDAYRLQRDTRVSNNLLANDVFTGSLTAVRVTREPQRGTASLTEGGILTYIGNPGACDYTDTLRYEICQAGVCDLATVTLRVRCGAVEAYDGFSPNGDGINDFFVIEGVEAFPDSRLRIYNRWGNEVFRDVGYNNDWGGTWDGGTDLVDGTYFYYLDLGGDEGIVTGWTFLWR